jgi:uncharacterized protein YkwD
LGVHWQFPQGLSAEQQAMLAQVNAVRAMGRDCGTRGRFDPTTALTWNPLLRDSARRHSDDMAQTDFFSHTGSDGSRVSDRTTDTGYNWRTVGENIAAGYATVKSVVEAWLGSDGHCANIMNPSFDEFGSAKAEDPNSTYRTYWTQVFAAPR